MAITGTTKPSATPPFRADIVGSLLRPAAIHDARARQERGELTALQVRAIESECIEQAVSLYREAGFKTCTDGEFHRRHWFLDFIEKIDGVTISGGLPVRFHNEGGEVEFSPPRVATTGFLRHSRELAVADFRDLAPIAERHGLIAKQTIPSPSLLHFRGGRAAVDRAAYPQMERFFDDLAAVYRQELAALYQAGCRYVQIDETNLPFLCDPSLRDYVASIGENPDDLPRVYAKLINDCLRDKPADMVACIHMCRGNHASSWIAEGGYDRVAEIAFNDIEVEGFFLEYDSERAGSFAPLRHVAADKTVILGLVTTKTPKLENKTDISRKIDQAARYLPLDRLGLSPQCGFASTLTGNRLTYDDQKRKLELVVEIAREVWGSA